jgi:hypothetical protein
MSGPQPTAYPIEPEKSWFARHLVVSIVTLIALAAVGLVVALLLGIMSLLKSSDVYQQAMVKAQEAPAVVESLGKPVKAGWWLSGNISVSGASGSADLAIPISGPKGRGTVYAAATKQAGEWRFKVLEVAIEGQSQRIPLVRPQEATPPRVRDQ